jgi:dihydrofolate reductase
MAKLVYAAIASLDGYVVDADGSFEWAAPDEEVHAFVNELERPIGTYLYGRRMYDVMRYWETADTSDGVGGDYARIWQSTDKIVYSTTLESVSTARTTLVRELEPPAVHALKAKASADISIGGPTLAGQALKAGLVDECHLFVTPVVVGGGTSWLPDVRVRLELLDSRRFAGGVVHLHYRVGAAGQRLA